MKLYRTHLCKGLIKGREPRSVEDAHRPLQPAEDLDRILTRCESRTLSKNLTLSYNSVIYQIKTKRAAYTMRGAQVEVREKSTGEVTIEFKGRALEYSLYREQEQQQSRAPPSKLLDVTLSPSTAKPKPKRGGVPM